MSAAPQLHAVIIPLRSWCDTGTAPYGLDRPCLPSAEISEQFIEEAPFQRGDFSLQQPMYSISRRREISRCRPSQLWTYLFVFLYSRKDI